MALNVITVTTACDLTVAGVQHHYNVNDTVNPGDPFYYPLLWGQYAVDSGNPPVGTITYNDSVKNLHVTDSELPYLGTDDLQVNKNTGQVKIVKSDGSKKIVSLGSVVERMRSNLLVRHGNRYRKLGPVTTDITSCVTTTTPDGTLNRQYLVTASSTDPTTWNYPADLGQGLDIASSSGAWWWPATPKNFTSRSFRVMTDAPKFALLMWNSLTTCGYQVFVDDAPVQLSPVLMTGSTQYLVLTFPNSAVRKIEVRSSAAMGHMYVAKPYKVWKPPSMRGPRLLVVGDSYVSPVVWTAAGAAQSFEHGIYQGIGDWLDIEDVWIDGIGGTGYLARTSGAGGPNNNYLDRIADHIRIAPEVLVVHGGGANDLVGGANTVSAVTTQVVSYFTQLRAALPSTKLIFVEGFGPPLSYSALTANYIALRTAVQAALTSVGAYYIDVATSDPWIDGTGYIPGHTTGVGNSDIYVGSDQIHLVDAGALYIRKRIAAKIQKIIYDDGALVNTLV